MTAQLSVEDYAAYLDRADRTHEAAPIPAAPANLADAYRVQDAFFAQRAERLGGAPAGFKIAMTSVQTQQAFGADAPAVGRYTDRDLYPSGSTIALERCFAPILEVELVFRVNAEVPPDAGRGDIAAVTDVAGGIECPDSRYRDWFGGALPVLSLPQVVADNCLAGMLVVGDGFRPAGDVDLTDIDAALSIDGETLASGHSRNVLGDPLNAVGWLVRHLADRGEHLTPGTVVSAGTLTAPVRVTPGVVRAVFGGGFEEVVVEFTRGQRAQEEQA